MRKKFFIFLISIMVSAANTYAMSENSDLPKAESDYKKNSAYLELGGNGILYSIGYDRLYKITNYSKLTLGSGLTYIFSEYYNRHRLWASPQINYLIGEKKFLEVGIGLTIPVITDNYINMPPLIGFYRLGFRYQREDGGLQFRIGLTPICLVSESRLSIAPWAGISIGWTF
ncbi:MAG: hypothetical protein KGZ97_11215 [Bacteroidetes bacterium]|nr:hypothetical protein [Bacteroidota bacterium]